MSAVKSVPTYRQILKLTKKYKVASLLFYTLKKTRAFQGHATQSLQRILKASELDDE